MAKPKVPKQPKTPKLSPVSAAKIRSKANRILSAAGAAY